MNQKPRRTEAIAWNHMEAEAVYENTEAFMTFMENNLPDACSVKTRRQLAVAFDEIYSNIVKYSQAARVELQVGTDGTMVFLRFLDDGIFFNPLESIAPDTDASAEERKVGGLGLFVAKKLMDILNYQYRDGRNVFTVGKKMAENADISDNSSAGFM